HVALSEDGRTLAWGRDAFHPDPKPEATLWDSDTLTPKGRLPAARGFVAAFSPGKRYVVTADEPDASLAVWETRTGRRVASRRTKAPVGDCGFSPDGALLATAGEWREYEKGPGSDRPYRCFGEVHLFRLRQGSQTLEHLWADVRENDLASCATF